MSKDETLIKYINDLKRLVDTYEHGPSLDDRIQAFQTLVELLDKWQTLRAMFALDRDG